MLPKLSVLFLCTGNSCRSQMAEAWTRVLHGDGIEAYSAGTAPVRVDPRAIRVMAEVGVDLSTQRSKHLAELAELRFDRVVTVCDAAREACPVPPGGASALHVPFDDPPRLAEGETEDAALVPFRRVRDEIRAFVLGLPALLERPEEARREDLDAVLSLLHASRLPVEGVAEAFPQGYRVLRRGGRVAAVAGLELHGDAGLLRSVAVDPVLRGAGLGRRLVQDRLSDATLRGLEAVYLLTTTASGFFRGMAFVEISRDSVPPELQATTEFASVCPSTATCMVRRTR